MATSNFKHLEFLPLDEDNLILSGDPESNIKSKSCINLGFIGLNSISRIQNIISINNSSATNYESFLDFSYSLETALAGLLIINTISNPQNTEITEHYRKYQVSIAAGKIIPSFTYCQNLIYSGFKTWGGLYGTVQYYIHLREQYEEYLSISEVAYLSARQLFSYSKTTSYNAYLSSNLKDYLQVNNLYTDLEAALEDNSIESDKNIYNFSKFLITGIPLIQEIYRELNFYSEWLPEVIQFLGVSNLSLVGRPKNNTEAAYNTLVKVVRVLRELGLSVESFKYIDSKFIRQNLPYNIFDVCSRLAQIRKESTFIELDSSFLTTEEQLANRFHQVISINRAEYDYLQASNLILTSFAPPGGYALTLTGLATVLLNRAYIVAYRNVRSGEAIQNNASYRRSIKLIGYAGLLLIKSGLPHLQAYGISLLRTYRVNIVNIDPNNLLDVY